MLNLNLPNGPAPPRNWNAFERNHGRAARLQFEEQQRNWNAQMNIIRQRNINEPGWRNREIEEHQRNMNAIRQLLQQRREEDQELNRVWGGPRQLVLQEGSESPNLNASMPPTETLRLHIDDLNVIEYSDFKDGEVIVRLEGDNNFIYKQGTLQGWFDTGKKTNPKTGLPITQDQIEVFTYEDSNLHGGRKSRRSKKSKKSKRSKKRKTNRRR